METTLNAMVDAVMTHQPTVTPIMATQADLAIWNHHQPHMSNDEKAAMWAKLKECLSDEEKMELYQRVSRAPTPTPLEDLQSRPTWADRILMWQTRRRGRINEAFEKTMTTEEQCPKDV